MLVGSSAGLIKCSALLQGISVVVDQLMECILLPLQPGASQPNNGSHQQPQAYYPHLIATAASLFLLENENPH